MNFTADYVFTNDYGGVAVIDCDLDSARSAFEVAANQMSDATQYRSEKDPFAELRKMSGEDRKDKAKIAKVLSNYFEEIDRKKDA